MSGLCFWPAKGQSDLSYLLNERERENMHLYEDYYLARFQTPAQSDPDLVCYLGDNLRYSCIWSATSGAVPTYRCTGGKLWIPSLRRWLLPSEKMASLGFPVFAGTANVLGAPVMPLLDTRRADSVCGNSFHLSNAAIVMLCGLACFGVSHEEPSVAWT